MKTALSTLAQLFLTSSVIADNQSVLPSTYVRYIGMKAIHKARSELISGRKLQFDDTSMVEGFDMSMLAPMVCMMLELEQYEDDFFDEMEQGLVCSEFGCDDAEIPNLIMKCNMDEEICDEDEDEEYCMKNTSVEMSMGLNYEGEVPISSKQCTTYTKPDYIAAMGAGCWEIVMKMDMGATMGAAMSGELDDTSMMTEEEAFELTDQYFTIDECSSSFDDGTTCECGICDGGIGFELSCTNDLISEKCTDMDTSTSDMFTMIGQEEQPGGPEGPSISILRLIKEKPDVNDASPPDMDGIAASPPDLDGMGASPASSHSGTVAATIAFALTALAVIV